MDTDTTRPFAPSRDHKRREQQYEVPQDGERYHWHRQTIAETFERIRDNPQEPWVAIGDFLDDWRFTKPEDRAELIQGGIASAGDDAETRRWAAFLAATVDWLCWQEKLPFPEWTSKQEYLLREPWFLYPGDLLRAWQLATTPTPFKMRNIFGGDHMLDRV